LKKKNIEIIDKIKKQLDDIGTNAKDILHTLEITENNLESLLTEGKQVEKKFFLTTLQQDEVLKEEKSLKERIDKLNKSGV